MMDSSDKESMFRQHIKELFEKKRNAFRKLLSETPQVCCVVGLPRRTLNDVPVFDGVYVHVYSYIRTYTYIMCICLATDEDLRTYVVETSIKLFMTFTYSAQIFQFQYIYIQHFPSLVEYYQNAVPLSVLGPLVATLYCIECLECGPLTCCHRLFPAPLQISLTLSWRKARKLIKSDPRYEKFGESDRVRRSDAA